MEIFVTGSTGYLGRRLIPMLTARSHEVLALVRQGSERRLPLGCTAIAGNALDGRTFAAAVPPGCTFVQLVGVPHPSPAKAAAFCSVDLVSVRESVAAASAARAAHFVYLSVAQPAPIMKAYRASRIRRSASAWLRCPRSRRADGPVIEPRDCPRFTLESLAQLRRAGHRGGDHLDGDGPVEPSVARGRPRPSRPRRSRSGSRTVLTAHLLTAASFGPLRYGRPGKVERPLFQRAEV